MFDKNIRIETPHLMIRPFNEKDVEAVYNIQSRPEMTRYTPDEPWKSMNDAEEFIKLALWLYDMEHHNFRHFFAVVEKQSNNLIGFCGIGGIEYDRSQNEVFYTIDKPYWEKGYATEAAKAMLEYGFVRLGLDKVNGAVHAENVASQKVLEKIGLKRAGTICGLPEEFSGYNGELLYSLSKDEYNCIE